MSEENHIVNAQEAENILNSDVFKLALANLKQEYIQHWCISTRIARNEGLKEAQMQERHLLSDVSLNENQIIKTLYD